MSLCSNFSVTFSTLEHHHVSMLTWIVTDTPDVMDYKNPFLDVSIKTIITVQNDNITTTKNKQTVTDISTHCLSACDNDSHTLDYNA